MPSSYRLPAEEPSLSLLPHNWGLPMWDESLSHWTKQQCLLAQACCLYLRAKINHSKRCLGLEPLQAKDHASRGKLQHGEPFLLITQAPLQPLPTGTVFIVLLSFTHEFLAD